MSSVDVKHAAQSRTELADSESGGSRWVARPAAVRVLRTVAVLLPLAASAGAIYVLNTAMPTPTSWGMVVVVAAVDLVVGLIVMVAVRRLALRILPLAMLLSLSLVFPDQAPHRFKIALRANSSARLRSRIAASRDEDADLATTTEDLLTFLAALARHDRVTRGHCERVRAFVDLLAAELKLSKEDQDRLRWAALFHDIGKLEVPGSILRKPGKPTTTEWETLKQHPVDGAKLIKPLAPWLGPWAMAVEQHHERFDGGGYPSGLSGHDISLGGRILRRRRRLRSDDHLASVQEAGPPGSGTGGTGQLRRCAIRSGHRPGATEHRHRRPAKGHGMARGAGRGAAPGHRSPRRGVGRDGRKTDRRAGHHGGRKRSHHRGGVDHLHARPGSSHPRFEAGSPHHRCSDQLEERRARFDGFESGGHRRSGPPEPCGRRRPTAAAHDNRIRP